MSGLADFRLTLRLLSPLGSPMQSDTLFGHLAWQVLFQEGEAGLAEFLAPFRAGDPPVVLSEAFPAGLLPRPLLPLGRRPEAELRTKADHVADKRLRKAPFLTRDEFLALIHAGRTPAEPQADPWITVEQPHAAIDRATGTTTRPNGQFYHTSARYLDSGKAVELYLRAQPGWAERVRDLFERMSWTGFGRKKSSGQGAFTVESLDPWPHFARPEGADGFVSLSTYTPAQADPTDGQWRSRVKRGFLGEGAGQGRPFKRPLLQLEPGAAFRDPDPRPVYGRLVTGLAPGLKTAVQYGYTLAVACRWPQAG